MGELERPRAQRLIRRPSLIHEVRAGYPRLNLAGVDEVGRGCIAGPVVAGAILLPYLIDSKKDRWLKKVNDSKMVQPAVRQELSPLIMSWALAFGIGVATPAEIDELNIFHASHLAMFRALEALRASSHKVDHVLVDGKFLPKGDLFPAATAIIKGDQKCLSIAAASIIAKVWRDDYMAEQDHPFPGYEFSKHKGYPTLSHIQAVKDRGICHLHRKSFVINFDRLDTT